MTFCQFTIMEIFHSLNEKLFDKFWFIEEFKFMIVGADALISPQNYTKFVHCYANGVTMAGR